MYASGLSDARPSHQRQADEGSAFGIQASVGADPVDHVGEQLGRQRLAEQGRAQQRLVDAGGPVLTGGAGLGVGFPVGQPAAADPGHLAHARHTGPSPSQASVIWWSANHAARLSWMRDSGISIQSRTTTRDTLPPMATAQNIAASDAAVPGCRGPGPPSMLGHVLRLRARVIQRIQVKSVPRSPTRPAGCPGRPGCSSTDR